MLKYLLNSTLLSPGILSIDLSVTLSFVIALISIIISFISIIVSRKNINKKIEGSSYSINYIDKNNKKREVKININDGKNQVDVEELLGEITVVKPPKKEEDKL